MTYYSDLLTGESRFDVNMHIDADMSHADLTFSGEIGQDTYTSAALTISGNLAPDAALSLPIQTASVANDLGFLRNPEAGERLSAWGRKVKKIDEGFGTIVEVAGWGSSLTSSYLSKKLPNSIKYQFKAKMW